MWRAFGRLHKFSLVMFPCFPLRMNGLPGLPAGPELEVSCCSDGGARAGWRPRSSWGSHPPWLVPDPPWPVPFHSPGLGCRPPGHSLLRYCQGHFFSFIAVKFHLVGFRPVFPERSGIPLAPSAAQGLPQPPGHSLPSKAHIPRPLLHSTHSFNKHPWNAHWALGPRGRGTSHNTDSWTSTADPLSPAWHTYAKGSGGHRRST